MNGARTELGTPRGAPRRHVLRAGGVLAAGATVGPLAGSAAAAVAGSRAHGASRGADHVTLTPTSAAGINAAEVDLPVRSSGAWTSPPLSADDFALIGFSWAAHAPTPTIEVRYRCAGDWQEWRALPVLDDRPDPDDEASLRHATQPLWVGSANGVQARVSGHRPALVVLSLIRPDVVAGDAAVGTPTLARRSAAAPPTSGARRRRAEQGTVARPKILRRTAWNADESWRSGRPSYNSTLQQVHVHHTVSGNDYTRAETPGLIRGMYYYHTHTLGWSDIGYNFLVDRFGRIWEGRFGGVGKLVHGAHTLGFNSTSCGISVIGNLEVVQPTNATLVAIAKVAAWKLSRYDRDPLGTTTVLSEGSDKFSRNRSVTLPVIDGHRDTNDTACPGRNLYARLGDIRQGTRALMDAVATPAITITTPYALGGDPTPGATLALTGGTYTPPEAVASYAWLRDGVPIRRASKPERVVVAADAGHQLSVVVTLTAENLTPLTQQVDALEPVRYQPGLDLSATSAGDQLTVVLVVRAVSADQTTSADGVDAGGTASLDVDGATQVVPVVDGRATATFTALPGAHTARATYHGSDVVRPGSTEIHHTVPRHP